MPFFNNENVYFTYDGGSYNGTLVATIHSPDVGVTYRFSCGDANSTPVQAAAVTDPLVLTISDIGDPNPSYTFTSRVWRLDNNQNVAIDVFEIGSTSAYRFGATWEYDGTRTVVVHFYGVSGVNYRMTTSDENGSLGLGDVVGANATTSISVTASGDYTNGFIGKLYTTDASAEDFAAHIFYQAVAIGISPDNDDYVAPEVIPPAGGVISGDTLNATTEGGEVYLLTQNFIVAPQSLW